MNSANLQQCVSGFKTVAVLGGPLIVRVHEALDASYQSTPHRYFVSVDFKFREFEALNIGKPGLLGCTKSEATRDANKLASNIFVYHSAMTSANERALDWDTFTNRYAAKLQTERFNKLVAKYTAEFTQ